MKTQQPEALRLADCLETEKVGAILGDSAAAELRRLHEVEKQRDELLAALNNLRSTAYWIVEGGEFAHWVNNKKMPYAAAKELKELAEMVQAAQAIINKAERTTT